MTARTLRKIADKLYCDPSVTEILSAVRTLLAQRDMLLSDRERLREERRDLVASLSRQELLGALARQGYFVLGHRPEPPYCGCPSCEGRHLTTETPQGAASSLGSARGSSPLLSRPTPEEAP